MLSQSPTPSTHLYKPRNGSLCALLTEREAPVLAPLHDAFTARIGERLLRSDRPCRVASRSITRDEYCLGLYEHFGEGRNGKALESDLLWFADEVKRGRSPRLTMWAIFPNAEMWDDNDFDHALVRELTSVTTSSALQPSWASGGTLRVGDTSFFVVGMHPQSTKDSRRFPWTALVFNVFDQVDWLEREGVYAWIREAPQSRRANS